MAPNLIEQDFVAERPNQQWAADISYFWTDNAVVETFFKSLKTELIWPVAWQTRRQAVSAQARYIDGFYNPSRRHSLLAFKSPVQFEIDGRKVSQQLSTKAAQGHIPEGLDLRIHHLISTIQSHRTSSD